MRSIAPSYKMGSKNLGSFTKRDAIQSLWRCPTVPGRLLLYILSTLMVSCHLAINLIRFVPSKALGLFDTVFASGSMALASCNISAVKYVFRA